MKISLAWLNTYLQQPTEAVEAEELLTNQGFPIEEIEDLADGDMMMDVEVTSNRPDCLSHVGVAREIAAGRAAVDLNHNCNTLIQNNLGITSLLSDTPTEDLTSVENLDATLCPVYTVQVIKGVKVSPSPKWLAQRIEAIGLRPVNNIVDITNFVLHETGQPLHTFDLDKLAGGRVIVRHAKAGEKFNAIDDSHHELEQGMLVIADENQPQAVAGVMGGKDSEVSDNTVNILLESASFAPLSIRKTSRSLKLASDSSFRFERGVDQVGILKSSLRAAQMIVDLAGGVIAKDPIVLREADYTSHTVKMSITRSNAVIGTALSSEQTLHILKNLELSPQLQDDQDTIVCTIPSHRLDLTREIDLIEEVVRLFGLDNIPVQDKIAITIKPAEEKLTAKRKLSQSLVGHGYFEAINHSLTTQASAKPFVEDGQQSLRLQEDKFQPILRPSILPSLLHCRKINQDMGSNGVRLFEIASVWHRADDEIVEAVKLGILSDLSDDQSLRQLTGALQDLVFAMAGKDAAIEIAPIDSDIYQTAGKITLGKTLLGTMGVANDKLLKQFGLQGKVLCAELDYETLLGLYTTQREIKQLSRFPGIERDLSILVAEEVTWAQIKAIVNATQPELMTAIAFVGVYRGKPLAKGIKSVSFRMTFNDPQATLTHEQVNAPVNAILEALKAKINASLRD